jgi:lipopolysaccharide export system protein LptA
MRLIFSLLLLLGGFLLTGSAYADNGLKADSKQPIDITADALEVDQEHQLATFSGNVVAVQGKMRLTSQTMKVHYKTGEKKAEKTKREQGISKIEVDGNVYLATEAETARGQTGVYDVDKERLTLRGNVVLTRGESVVKGDALEYDLASGRSRIIGAGVSAESLKSGESSGKSGRVRGRFVPEKKGSGAKEPEKKEPEVKGREED